MKDKSALVGTLLVVVVTIVLPGRRADGQPPADERSTQPNATVINSDFSQGDFAALHGCLGAFAQPPAPGCQEADLSGDCYVDQADVEAFMACHGGANTVLPPGCMY